MHRAAARLAPLLLAALAVPGTGCLRARGTPEEPVVTALQLTGVTAVKKGELVAKLATQPSSCFVRCEVHRLDPDALLVDRRRVEAFYRERGYYQAVVERTELLPSGEGRVRVVLHVREGKPVRVTRLTVSGLDEAPEARRKAGRLPIAVGLVFREADYDAARARLLGALRSTGWALAEVTQRAQVLPEDGTAEVTYQVEAGQRFRFGRVFVAGSGAVPRGKIIEQAAIEATPGAWYDEASLPKAQARVFEMGVFGGVRVARGTPDPERLTVPVVVTVREAPFHTVRAGPGVGLQQSRWNAGASASWVHRNWLGDLRRLQLDAKAGWAWLPLSGRAGRNGPVGLLAAEFSQPGAISRRIDLTTRVELERGLERDYGFWSERFRVGTPIRLLPRLTLVPSWNLEVYQLRDVLAEVQTGTGQFTLPQFRSCPDRLCVLSYLEQRVVLDLRDDPIETRRGAYLAVSVQEGLPMFGAGYQYLRVLPEARFYWPLGAGTVLALRARAGAVIPVAEPEPPPVLALFRSGGANAMRGYGWERLSPMELDGTTWVATGGNGLVDGSLEVRRRLVGSVGGVLFLDGANVAAASSAPGQWRDVLDLTKVQLSAGLGLRYATAFGPARIDAAMRLPTDWSKGTAFPHRFPAVPGDSGHREPIAAVHVSLGEAF